MIKTQERSGISNRDSIADGNVVPFLVTPSLLNSWAYIFLASQNVREAASDTMCLEDKADQASERAKEEFIDTLKKVKKPPNEAMQKGIDFERECYLGNTPISPIIEGGAFQIVGKKNVIIDDIPVLLYGRLDVLKNGTIYDIKRVRQYKAQKYLKSYQHGFYLDLFEEASAFTYLAYDDGEKLHQETYYRGQYTPTETVVKEFFGWLKLNNLWEIYEEHWKSKK